MSPNYHVRNIFQWDGIRRPQSRHLSQFSRNITMPLHRRYHISQRADFRPHMTVTEKIEGCGETERLQHLLQGLHTRFYVHSFLFSVFTRKLMNNSHTSPSILFSSSTSNYSGSGTLYLQYRKNSQPFLFQHQKHRFSHCNFNFRFFRRFRAFTHSIRRHFGFRPYDEPR